MVTWNNSENTFLERTTVWKVSVFGVFWSIFSRIRTEHGENTAFSPNAGKITTRKTLNKVTFHAVVVQLTLSLFGILDILNLALSPRIYPVPWSFCTWSKQKTLSISNLHTSNFCLRRTNFFVPWAVFSRYLELFRTFPKLFVNFSSRISLFSTPACTIQGIVPARKSKDSQIDFFWFFCWPNVLTGFFVR